MMREVVNELDLYIEKEMDLDPPEKETLYLMAGHLRDALYEIVIRLEEIDQCE